MTANNAVQAPRGPVLNCKRLASGSRASLPDEQSRSGRRRKTGRSDRLRRRRQSRAQLGLLSTRSCVSCDALENDETLAGAIRQTRRRFSHARIRAASFDRQLKSCRRVGQLGTLSRTRTPRPDDVRPDDGRQLDLHRHAGHRSGHV